MKNPQSSIVEKDNEEQSGRQGSFGRALKKKPHRGRKSQTRNDRKKKSVARERNREG